MGNSGGPRQAARKPFPTFAVVAVLVAGLIDQGTKLVVQTLLPPDVAIEVGQIFHIEHVHNSGFAFSFLADSGRIPLAVTIIAALVVIGLWLRNAAGGRIVSLGFALALGGIISNLADRLRIGEVFDFLVFHMDEHDWFALNLADAEIVLGLLVLVSALPTRAEAGGSRSSQRPGDIRPTEDGDR